MKPLQYLAGAVLAMLLCTPGVNAGTFKVGPYYLGMTDIEARRIGVSGCKAWTDTSTRCNADYGPIAGMKEFTVGFDNRTRQVTNIRLKTGLVRYGDPSRSTSRTIDIVDCLPSWSDGHECYMSPDKVLYQDRSFYWNNLPSENASSYEIEASINRWKVTDFVRARGKAARAAREAQRFQTGK